MAEGELHGERSEGAHAPSEPLGPFEPGLDQDPKRRGLIDRALARVRRVAFRRTGDHDASKDIAQDVVLDMLKKANDSPGFLSEELRVMAYVAGMADNQVKEFLRSERRRRETDAIGRSEYIDYPRFGADTEADAAYQMLAERIDDIIDALPVTRRLVIVHQLHSRATYAETAQALLISVKTVEAHVSAAFGAIRTQLAALAPAASRNGASAKRARTRRLTKAERLGLLESIPRGGPRHADEEAQSQ